MMTAKKTEQPCSHNNVTKREADKKTGLIIEVCDKCKLVMCSYYEGSEK